MTARPLPALAALTVLLLSGCPQRSVLDRSIRLPPGFEVQLENVIYERLDARGKVSEAHTAHALMSPTSGVVRFERAELTLRSDEDFGHEVEVVAGGGSANLFTGRMLLAKGVRLKDGTGRRLDTPSAAYSPDDGTVAGPGPATLSGPNYLLRAETGFVVELGAGVVDLQGPVTGFVEELPRAAAPASEPAAPAPKKRTPGARSASRPAR